MRKKIISILILVCFMFTLIGCGQSSQTSEGDLQNSAAVTIPNDEYHRAIWLGIVPNELITKESEKSSVTWKQYCEMIGNVIKKYDASKADGWKTLTEKAPNETMNRDDAMITLVFAGKTMGLDSFNGGTALMPDYDWPSYVSWDYPVFDWEVPFAIGSSCVDEHNCIGPAFEYCTRRISCISAKSLLLPDENGDMHLDEKLTLHDAVLSAIRLYESDETTALNVMEDLMYSISEEEEVQAIYSLADEMRDKILNDTTTIVKSNAFIKGETYTGTAYYVSNQGDDNNNGLSPETPWASLQRLNSVDFAYGDIIFFERGSTWRKAQLPNNVRSSEGLSLSAYGTGEKPKFYGSAENGTGREKWSLYHEGNDGQKIWKYYKNVADCGAIVVETGQYIKRDVAYWENGEFWCLDELEVPYTPEEQLKDGELFCALPYENASVNERLGYDEEKGVELYLEGALYVRCDEGNPGEVYSDMEFISAYTFSDGYSDDMVFDNLSIQYSTGTFTSGYSDGVAADGVVIQNCEFAYMGGGLRYFSKDNGNFAHFFMDGGGIGINGNNDIVRNNYCHHCFQEGIAYECFEGDNEPISNTLIEDNLIEYCVMGLMLINWDTAINPNHTFSNITIQNNLVHSSGFESYYNIDVYDPDQLGNLHWSNQTGYLIGDSHCFSNDGGPNAHDETVKVTNNIFAFSIGQLLRTSYETIHEGYAHIYNGNTYMQIPGCGLFTTENEYSSHRVVTLDKDSFVEKDVNDSNAAVVVQY